MQYRQGDVLLVKVESLPAKKKKIERESGRIILAHGEVTGHAHAINHPGAQFWLSQVPGDRSAYLELSETTELQHEEHACITLEPGFYQVVRQREFDGTLSGSIVGD